MGRFRRLSICLTMISIISIMGIGIVYADSNLMDIDKAYSYSSFDYYNVAMQLTTKYPEIVHMETIGYSVDNKPIYSIILTANVKDTISKNDFNTYRMHTYVEGGNHARETVNPAIILKQIEDYAKDYYDDSYIKEFSLKKELNEVAIHFIPLVNPDGHDLTKFGLSSVKTHTGLAAINKVSDTKYSTYKANINGVDLNRNFPDEYVDDSTGTWINKFQKHPNHLQSWAPSSEYYGGPYGGSEPETQAIMNYIHKYDFRNFLSFHSQGEIIYTAKKYFNNNYNKRERELGKIAADITGYTQIHESTGKGSGYFSDFTAALTLKPNVTVETTKGKLPSPQANFRPAYEETMLLPLFFGKAAKSTGYFNYRLYVNNRYVRDFDDEKYALANARKLGGLVIEGQGTPQAFLIEPASRRNFIEGLVQEHFDITNLVINATDTFKDDNTVLVTFAKNNGLLNMGDGFFRPNDNITLGEAAALVYRFDTYAGKVVDDSYLGFELKGEYEKWADIPIKYMLYKSDNN